MSRLTLQNKYIAFLITTLLLVLLLNGFLFVQLLGTRSENEHQQRIYLTFDELHEELNSLKQQVTKVSNNLAQRQDILSSVNLINRYQNVENYQPLIFDVEKENLATELALNAHTADIDISILLDREDNPIAFYFEESEVALSGYISYEDGQPKIMVATGDSDNYLPYNRALPSFLFTPQQSSPGLDKAAQSSLIVEQNGLYSTSTSYLRTTHIDNTEQVFGKIIVAKEISSRGFTSAIAHLGVEFSMYLSGSQPTNPLERLYLDGPQVHQPSLEESHKSGHSIHPLINRGGYLFSAASLPIQNKGSGVFIVGFKQALIEEQIADFRLSILIVLLITAFVITPLAIYLMNSGLLRPLKQLTDGVHNISKGDFIQVEGATRKDELGELAASFNNMVGELKRREDQLRTLSMATEQSPVSILISSPNDLIEYVNPQFEITSGFTANEVVGHTMSFLFKQSGVDEEQANQLRATVASGKGWFGEFSPRKKNGESYRLRISIAPIGLADGTITHYLYIAEDITEQSINEEILRNSQKMDAVGQLTGGIAHDFNNILGIVMGNLELLKISLKDQPVELERIDRALTSTQRGAQLTRKLLGFSRQDPRGQEVTQINQFIEGMQELIAKSITAVIQVKTHLAKDLWPVEIDSGDLEDAILNLSLNARDAMPLGGVLVIETANKHLDANYVKQHPTALEGDYVMVSISDTGTGMSEEVQQKIFDPFFTTKELGKGTGLGLSMVYGFVLRSGGHIQLYSEQGKGTSFHLYIPRAMNEHNATSDGEQATLPRGNETILIVDDEETLSEVAESSLQQLGYQTLVAYSGKEALEILAKTGEIDLIFSDVVMPGGVDGYQLAFAALKQQSTVKVLLTSGFTSKREEFTNEEHNIYLKLAENLLGKPYNLSELAVAIRRTLDASAPQ